MRRTPLILAGVAVLVVTVTVAVVRAGSDSHRSRQHAVAARGSKVMPFSLDATTHVFAPTATGGTQPVIADDRSDRDEVRLIREHLRKEAAAFERGDLGDPAEIHGRGMPGLAELAAGYSRFGVTYRDLPNGGEITYRTDDRELIVALERWFDAQLSDHGEHGEAG